GCLRYRNASILHQLHRLKLELAAELPSLHSNSPVPLNTLSRCPRNRQQANEQQLTEDIVALARRYGRYGYRKIAELLRSQMGWVVNDKRVERIWRQEGLKVPAKQPKKGRLWLADGSCIRLRAE